MSQLDRRNFEWFERDNSCGTLLKIWLNSGALRGLNTFKMDLTYPITAIAGENGSGKSTILAMAACAFHNRPSGYKMPGEQKSYYTFSDFFVQSSEEEPPAGISIRYQIIHDNWKRSEPGPSWQTRSKRVGGKWNHYHLRVNRNVVYFGVQRIVPSYESSVHRSYRRYFAPSTLDDATRERIRVIAGKIMGKTMTISHSTSIPNIAYQL